MTISGAWKIIKMQDLLTRALSAHEKTLRKQAVSFIRASKKRRPNPSVTTRGRGAHPRNPVMIYARVLRVEAQKGPTHRCDAECKKANHCYFHDFKAGAIAWGMPDGSVLLKSKTGRKLWGMF